MSRGGSTGAHSHSLIYRNEDGEVQSRPSPPRFVREQLPEFIRQVRQEFRIWNPEIYIADMNVDIQQEIMYESMVAG